MTYSIVPPRAAADDRLSRTALRVLVALGRFADGEGRAWPSLTTIAATAGLRRPHVPPALTQLEALGYLERERRRDEAGDSKSNMYRIVPDEVVRRDGPPGTPGRTTVLPPDGPPGGTPGRTLTTHLLELPTEGSNDGRTKRGTRLPADWQPDEHDREFSRSLRLDPEAIAPEFRDYWHAKAGAGGTKLDWSATWRNWCRKSAVSRPRDGRASPAGFVAALRPLGDEKQGS